MRSAFAPLLLAVVLNGCQCEEPLAELVADIAVDPEILDLGAVQTRVVHTPTVTVGNRGTGSLTLISVTVDPATSAFAVVTAPGQVQPGDAQPITLSVSMDVPGPVSGDLIITSNDPDTPRLVVPLRAEGGVAHLFIAPDPIVFGTVNEGAGAARTVTVANDGLDGLVISALAVVDDVGFDVDATALGPLPATLLPGDSQLIVVSLSPNADLIANNGGDADLQDLLRVTTNVGTTDVDITASINLAPVPNAVERDTRRPVVKAGVNDIIVVDGSDTFDPEGDDFSFAWSVIERPNNSVAAIIGQGQPQVRITPDFVGRYLVRLRATDVHGAFADDVLEILPRDLSVVLRWAAAPDAPCRAFSDAQCAAFSPNERRQRCCGQSDLDLHLIAPGGTLGDYGTCPVTCPTVDFCAEESDLHVDECRQTGLDCSFANRLPEWGQRGRFDDPSLDIDDVGGDGPEIISLNDPADGSYRVVVHYCQDRIGEPSVATVTIFDQEVLLRETAPQPVVAGQAWVAAVLIRSATGWQVISQPGLFESNVPADLCAQ